MLVVLATLNLFSPSARYPAVAVDQRVLPQPILPARFLRTVESSIGPFAASRLTIDLLLDNSCPAPLIKRRGADGHIVTHLIFEFRPVNQE